MAEAEGKIEKLGWEDEVDFARCGCMLAEKDKDHGASRISAGKATFPRGDRVITVDSSKSMATLALPLINRIFRPSRHGDCILYRK
jgi:hypothetical protein